MSEYVREDGFGDLLARLRSTVNMALPTSAKFAESGSLVSSALELIRSSIRQSPLSED
jgi:hypothetical protein